MTTYVIRRMLAIIPVLLVVTGLVFIMLDLVPGDPIDALLSQTDGTISPEDRVMLREELGLNDALPVRYVRWLAGIAHRDLGTSVASGQPVFPSILDRFPSTLELTVAGIGVAVVLGFVAGTLAALNRAVPIDNIAMAVAMVGISMPPFWLGLLLLLAFAVHLPWFPVISSGSGWHGLVLPALTLGIRAAGIISRLVRSSMIDVLTQDYIRTARAKGLSAFRVIWSHALKNTLVPVVTIVGLQFGSLLGGAVIVEAVFARRGMGQLVIQGIQVRDFPRGAGNDLVHCAGICASEPVRPSSVRTPGCPHSILVACMRGTKGLPQVRTRRSRF